MKYLAIIEQGETGYGALIPDLPGAFAVGESVAETLESLSEVLTIMLEDYAERGLPVPAPSPVLDSDSLELEGPWQIREVEPASRNRVSTEVDNAIIASGLTRSEIARRMNTSASVLSRMTNPFYRGHSLSLLQRFAQAIDGTLEVRIVPPGLPAASESRAES